MAICSSEPSWDAYYEKAHPTPTKDADAKCPSVLHVMGIMPEGKVDPESAVTPLSANERTDPTTSPVVAFSRSPLRRGTSVLRVDDIDSKERAQDLPCAFIVEAGPERPCGPGLSGRIELSCQDCGELRRREGALPGHCCCRSRKDDSPSEVRERRGEAHLGLVSRRLEAELVDV